MTRKILILSVTLLFVVTAVAKEELDSSYHALYHSYLQLYNTDRTAEFYEASAQMQQVYLKHGDIDSYYMLRQNEILYDAEHGEAYKAIKKANALLEEMKNSKVKSYERVYISLGAIFESFGNYRMAVHYYQEALSNVASTDTERLMEIYSHLVSVNFTHNTDKAWQWNERLAGIISHDDLTDYKSYLANKGQIYFYKKEKENFSRTKHEYESLPVKSDTSSAHCYGEHVLKVMEDAFIGQYDEAMQLLEQETEDYDDLKRYDIRIQIYEMMGKYELALQEADKRRDLRDSLSNNLFFSNINEINMTAGIAKLSEKAAKEHELWLGVVIILLFIGIGLMISRYLVRRSYQKKIEKQNEQLEIALDEAKESDRRKGIFIQHISHEIRTPLNIINGYVQVIANTEMELEDEERDTLLQEINQNTIAITDIIDDLLEISQEKSKERYRKSDQIAVNKFCRDLVEEVEKTNYKGLKLDLRTNLPDNFTIQSNEDGIKRILRQLLNNALKFTEEGHIEFAVYESTNDDDDDIHFTITDTGIGIPEEQYEQVFERFYKIDTFRQGLGIGLPMSRKIAILLGGTLIIDKKYHEGTRMVLTIPVK